MSAGFPDIGQTPRALRPVIAGSGDRQQHLERLGPLINELIAHDLVSRTPAGAFELRDDVQGHLEAISEKKARTVAPVYIGRSCMACGVLAPTTLTGTLRRCESCRRSLDDSGQGTADSPPPMVDRQTTRPRWVRRAS